MNLNEVHRLLQEQFQKELTNGRRRHIVFWYDEEEEFVNDIDEIKLEGVRIWKVTDYNLFATKFELEKNDTTSHFLLYSAGPKPSPDEDWLYDQYKLGQEFTTDKLTIIMREVGITDDRLKEVFRKYKAFFNNKARLQAFRKHQVTTYTEETIDITVLAALCKSPTNTLDDIIRTLMHKEKEGDDKAWENILKYGDESTFWMLIEKHYGYTLKNRTLQSFLLFMMLTYLRQQSDEVDFPGDWKPFVSNRPTNVIVFMDQWMNHQGEWDTYNELAYSVADEIDASEYIKNWDIHKTVHMDVFHLFDENMIHYIVDQLMEDLRHYDDYLDMIATRRRLHWYPEYKYEYEALYHAIHLLRQMEQMDYFIREQSSTQMFRNYTTYYYSIDTAYRKFYVAYDQVEKKERIYTLREKVENTYNTQFMDELAVKWGASLERKEDWIWAIPDIPQQNEFYRHFVQSHLQNGERVFVIISDALRYEVANELAEVLTSERQAVANLSMMQGVLPSYTALGMAALLPHKQISYTQDGNVKLDGVAASGTKNRNHILQNREQESLAIQYQDMVRMNRANLRATLHGKKVIYIYHNVIDARGDNADTEMEVFQAAEEAIDDIRILINRLVNAVSAANILITSDHGFIYQRDHLKKSQKLPRKPEETLIMNRRFSISHKNDSVEGTFTYPMDYILHKEYPLYATVPRGINRFAIQGAGANYVHGGLMPQEIAIPVISFKNDRSKSTVNAVTKVDVKLTTPIRKITNTATYLEFFQMDKVADKSLPRRLRLYFADGVGNRVTNEIIIIADRTTSLASERVFKEKFIFQEKLYDRHEIYYLIVEDEEDSKRSIYEKYAFTIDIILGGI